MTTKFCCPCCVVIACWLSATWLSATICFAEDLERSTKLRSEIRPIVAEIEACMLGKPHEPFGKFVADDAIFEESDSSLMTYLKRLDERLATDGQREFPPQSKLYWTLVKDSSLARMFERYAKLNKDESVLVFRELSRRNGQLKAIGYVVQKNDNDWKVVFAFEGSGPEAQLSENAEPFVDGP